MAEKAPKTPVPQQKTFLFSLTTPVQEIDKHINEWLEKKVLEDKITPFGLTHTISENEISYVYSYTKWVEIK